MPRFVAWEGAGRRTSGSGGRQRSLVAGRHVTPSILSYCVAWSLVGSHRGSTGTLVVLTTRGGALLGSPTGTNAGYQRLSRSEAAPSPRPKHGPTPRLGQPPTRGPRAPRTSAPSTPPAAGRPKSRRHARRCGRSCRPSIPRWWRVGCGARGSCASNSRPRTRRSGSSAVLDQRYGVIPAGDGPRP